MSFHYLLFVKASVMAVDALVSLASAAGMFRMIKLALMTAVPSLNHCDPEPGREAEFHSRRNDISGSQLGSYR